MTSQTRSQVAGLARVYLKEKDPELHKLMVQIVTENLASGKPECSIPGLLGKLKARQERQK